MHSVQYRDLVQLIKYQREKLNTQQAELTKVSMKCNAVKCCELIRASLGHVYTVIQRIIVKKYKINFVMSWQHGIRVCLMIK